MRPTNALTANLEMSRLAMQTAMMMAEANMVIFMRLWGLAGFWNVTPFESRRMVQEKAAAARAAALAAGMALATGRSPAAAAEAALKPVRRRTRSNVQRLVRRGPGLAKR